MRTIKILKYCSPCKINDNVSFMKGAELKLLRHGLGLSKEAIAAFCVVKEEVVCDWEQDKLAIPKKWAHKLMRLEEELSMAANDYLCNDIDDFDGDNTFILALFKRRLHFEEKSLI